MRAFTITAPSVGELREVPTPEPGAGEAIVKTAYCGICGTDYSIYRGDFLSSYPLTNGHEFTGTIVALGAGAAGWREGDRVAVDPTISCGACYRCLKKQFNHCDHWGAIGDTTAGALAEYVRTPIRNLYRIEDHESLDEAAFTEPLACVVWGIQRLRVLPGDRALVFGAGAVGNLFTQMLAMSNVADLVVVDVAEEKLTVAREMGALATHLSSPELPDVLLERTHGRKFDLVIECTGVPQVVQGLFEYAAPNARIMPFGVSPMTAEIRVRPFDVYHQDWEIIGSMAINGTFQQARDLVASGRINVGPLLSQVASLDDAAAILGRPKTAAEQKVMIAPSGRSPAG